MKKKWGRALLLPSAGLILWWLAAGSGYLSAYLLPTPKSVAEALIELAGSGMLLKSVRASILRVAAGFSLAFAAAMLIGILQGLYPKIRDSIRPVVDFARNIPPLSLIPLLILWFGIGEPSKVALIFLAAFFPVFLNIEKGISCCDPGLQEVGVVFGLTKREIFRKILLPNAVPDILVGMQVGLGYSWRALVGAEMIAAESGLGYLILDAQYMARTDKVIAVILVIGLTGYCCNRLFDRLIDNRLGEERLCE